MLIILLHIILYGNIQMLYAYVLLLQINYGVEMYMWAWILFLLKLKGY